MKRLVVWCRDRYDFFPALVSSSSFAPVLPVHFCTVFGLYLGYRVGIDELLEEAILREATMSHHEIVARFKKLFGREMTPKERQSFFLPYDSKSPENPPK
jgi:hypothetical protein